LQGAGQQTAEILESMADAFYAVDHEWRFTYVNHRAEVIWGIQRESLLGRNLWEAFPASVGGVLEQELRRVAEFRHPVQFDLFSSVMGRWLVVGINPTVTDFRSIFATSRSENRRKRCNGGFFGTFLSMSPMANCACAVRLPIYRNACRERDRPFH
jgi:PAS domain S-box-containing protein